MNWQRGVWHKGAAAPAAEAKIIISADWASIRTFEPIIARAPAAIYGDLLPVLRQADLRLTNLECPLTQEEGAVWKSGSVLRGSPASVAALNAVPFEAVTLANNHVFDYGITGFKETLAILRQHRIQTVGAGMTAAAARRALKLEVKGYKLAIVNFSEAEDLTAAANGPGVRGWEIEQVARQIRHLRGWADAIIAIGHCGLEYIPCPPPYVVQAFEQLAEAGADLVLGHHPHVPQGIQIHRGVPICYSLGNFIFYQETNLKYRKLGYLVQAELGRGGLSAIRIIPYRITPTGLSLLRGHDRARFFADGRKISRPLQTADDMLAAWHGFLRYYGKRGFSSEVQSIMTRFDTEPQKAAAMFRNRVTTMQHREHWTDFLTRSMDGTLDDTPTWAYDLARTWLTEHAD